jgi:4'-phosphopantetheinyl transferase
MMLGCDLEAIEPRIDTFVTDYFTNEEQSLLRQTPTTDRSALITLLWSAKESALKALREGLRLSTLALNVHITGQQHIHTAEWFPLQVQYSRRVLHGWWQRRGDFVRTVVTQPLAAPPVALHLPVNDSTTTGLRWQTRYPFFRACS